MNYKDAAPANAAAPEVARASAMAPFARPVFRPLWLATLVSNLEGLVQAVAVGWTITTVQPFPYPTLACAVSIDHP